MISNSSEESIKENLKVTYEKMSKSKGNGVAPGAMAVKYGVDSLRMAIMFGAPPENDLNFEEKSLQAMRSYLDRVSRLSTTVENLCTTIDLNHDLESLDLSEDDRNSLSRILSLLQDYHLKIDKHRHFHVAIARLMEITNILQKLDCENSKECLVVGYLYLLKGLYPFAPHLSSELWQSMALKLSHGRLPHALGLDASQADIRLS